MKEIVGQQFDEERALYGISHTKIRDCAFRGEKDGESALKESHDLYIENTEFCLRYPLWHNKNTALQYVKMTETCRAALWYCENLSIGSSSLRGIKALRECHNVDIKNSEIDSSEFGWFSQSLSLSRTYIRSEYAFLHAKDLHMEQVELYGKYSFQYVENAVIRHAHLHTKDAFWHSKNLRVEDSVIEGEYLGWYSEDLHLVRCKIVGTQPLCYAKNLILEDCETENCDLAFEMSSVTADIKGGIDSVKNPKDGRIICDSVGSVIATDPASLGKVLLRADTFPK